MCRCVVVQCEWCVRVCVGGGRGRFVCVCVWGGGYAVAVAVAAHLLSGKLELAESLQP